MLLTTYLICYNLLPSVNALDLSLSFSYKYNKDFLNSSFESFLLNNNLVRPTKSYHIPLFPLLAPKSFLWKKFSCLTVYGMAAFSMDMYSELLIRDPRCCWAVALDGKASVISSLASNTGESVVEAFLFSWVEAKVCGRTAYFWVVIFKGELTGRLIRHKLFSSFLQLLYEILSQTLKQYSF